MRNGEVGGNVPPCDVAFRFAGCEKTGAECVQGNHETVLCRKFFVHSGIVAFDFPDDGFIVFFPCGIECGRGGVYGICRIRSAKTAYSAYRFVEYVLDGVYCLCFSLFSSLYIIARFCGKNKENGEKKWFF